jgi:hypothetical protein
MLNRNVHICATCNQEFVLAYGVGLNTRTRLAFPCPKCKAILRCTYVKDYATAGLDIETQDFTWKSIVSDARNTLPGVTVAADIPVHKSFKGQGIKLGGSIWLSVFAASDKDYLSKAAANWNELNEVVMEHLPNLRRAASCWRSGDSANLPACIKGVPGCAGEDDFALIATGLQHMMDLCFVQPKRSVAERDIMQLVNKLSRNTTYKTLLQQFMAEGFTAHIDRLVDLCERTLLHFDAAIPGLVGESVEAMSKTGFADYRLFRDDYTELQSLYVEAFEVTSKLVAFLGCCLNVTNRGAADRWSNGSHRTLSSCLKLAAADREFISTELPCMHALMSEMDRHLRNRFGHYNVRYEARDGCFHDGSATLNAIEFHIDYLNHIRVLDLFLTFARRLMGDMKRQGALP